MAMKTKEEIQQKPDAGKDILLNTLGYSGSSFLKIVEQNNRIYEDLLKNYTSEAEAEKYCREQISLFRSSAGLLCPVSQAQYIIDLYHEILNEKKEFAK